MSTREVERDAAPGTVAELAAIAGPITAVLAVAGAAWYGLLSLGAAIVYSPLGVQPRELGLSSGAVLTQAAIGVAVIIVMWLGTEFIMASLLKLAKGPTGADPRTEPPSHIKRLLGAGISVFIFALLLVLSDAITARIALRDGKRPVSVVPGLSSPWPAEVASLAWATDVPPEFTDLPSCALYLGQADGTAVLYDAAAARTLRIPTSMLIVVREDGRARC